MKLYISRISSTLCHVTVNQSHKYARSSIALPLDAYLCAVHIAFMVVKALHQSRVVPILDVVVWAVMNLHLNGVPSIVDEEDDWVQLVPDHGGHILHPYHSSCCQHC